MVKSFNEYFDDDNNNISYDEFKAILDKEINEESRIELEHMEYIFDKKNKLDSTDFHICIAAGVVASIIDMFFVGTPGPSINGTKAGVLSNKIRKIAEEKLGNFSTTKYENMFKVCYDPANNANTETFVDGLSAYYHRLLSLGHDPLLGLIFGLKDIMDGTFTTIDKAGKIVVQNAPNTNAIKTEIQMGQALITVLGHFVTDIATPMGLPAPLMALFNLCQFGSIGEDTQTIAQIVQGMYYEGHDFIHFGASSVSVIVNELMIRLLYYFKEKKNIKRKFIRANNRLECPKLKTMLFISHTIACGGNSLKIIMYNNPAAVNLAQWYCYVPYAISQIKWSLFEKAALKDKYVKLEIEKYRKEIDKKLFDLGIEF